MVLLNKTYREGKRLDTGEGREREGAREVGKQSVG